MRHENKKPKDGQAWAQAIFKERVPGTGSEERIYCICCSDFKGVLVSFAAMETERITIEKAEYEQQELEKAAAALKSELSRLKLENIILRDKAEKLRRFLS